MLIILTGYLLFHVSLVNHCTCTHTHTHTCTHTHTYTQTQHTHTVHAHTHSTHHTSHAYTCIQALFTSAGSFLLTFYSVSDGDLRQPSHFAISSLFDRYINGETIFLFYVDINECLSDTLNNCHENAQCINTAGNYTCSCKPGYTGDGVNCIST